jgi:hypothetical protein
MASNYLSDHFGADRDGDEETAFANPEVAIPSGVSHSRLRCSIATVNMVDTLPVSDDTYRMFTLKSSDRIMQLWSSSDAQAAGSNTLNLGCMLEGGNGAHDGVVLDEDLFASLLDIASGYAMTNHLHESTTVPDESAGIPLWEMVVLGADPLSWTKDPLVNIDITYQVGTAATNGGLQRLMCFYTSGA